MARKKAENAQNEAEMLRTEGEMPETAAECTDACPIGINETAAAPVLRKECRAAVATVREEPRDGARVVAVIGWGDAFEIAEEADGWSRLANGLGYIKTDLLKEA